MYDSINTRPRWAVLLVAVATALLIAACSGDDDTSTELTSAGVADNDPAAVVATAWEAWSAADEDAFFALFAGDAVWFGSSLATDAGQDAAQYSWGLNTTMGARFFDYTCIDTGESSTEPAGSIVQCEGLFEDLRTEAFQADPAAVTGRYAVANGKIVNALVFDSGPVPDWAAFLDDYLNANHGDEMAAACDGPDSSGEACAGVVQAHLEEAATAWSGQ
jgi:hypothetical protein